MPRAWLSRGQSEGTAENGRHLLLRKTHRHTGGPSGHRSTVTRTQGWNHPPNPPPKVGCPLQAASPLEGPRQCRAQGPHSWGRGGQRLPNKDSVLSIHDNSSADRSCHPHAGSTTLKGKPLHHTPSCDNKSSSDTSDTGQKLCAPMWDMTDTVRSRNSRRYVEKNTRYSYDLKANRSKPWHVDIFPVKELCSHINITLNNQLQWNNHQGLSFLFLKCTHNTKKQLVWGKKCFSDD